MAEVCEACQNDRRSKYLLRLLVVVLFLLTAYTVAAQGDEGRKGRGDDEEGGGRRGRGAKIEFTRPSVTMERAAGRIRIDGRLDEPAWAKAAVINRLTQVEPDEGAEPTEATEVLLLFDDDNLYIGVRARYGGSSRIIATEMERDAEFESDDFIAITLDTFLDRRNGYAFRTNPLSARSDGLIENNRPVRANEWDGIWSTKSSITPEGWVAEIAIPFKTVSFDNRKTVWGFNIERTIRCKNEIVRWSGTGISRSIEELALAGDMQGLAGINQGVGLDIVPGFAVSHKRKNGETVSRDTEFDPFVDAFYKVLPSMTAALTVNTDFADTEVDEREINLSRFDIFLPEKRKFFLQDEGIFQFGGIERNGRPFFSRKVGLDEDGEKVDIVAGAKVTGRAGPLNIGALAVRQDDSKTREATNLYVVRPSLNVLKESSVGMILTNGNPIETEKNRVLGFDFLYRDSEFMKDQVVRTDFWWQRSFRDDIQVQGEDEGGGGPPKAAGADENKRGDAYGVTFQYPNEPVELTLGIQEIQKDFQPALGFVNRRGIRQYTGEGRYRWRFRPDSYIRFIDSGFSAEVVEKLDENYTETSEISFNALRIDTRDGDRLQLGYKQLYERLDEDFEINNGIIVPVDSYQVNRFFAKLMSSPRRWISGGFEIETGEFYDGDRTQLKPSIQFRPVPFFFLSAEYQYNDINLKNGNFDTHLVRSRVRLQFTPDITWSTLLQWDNLSDACVVNSIFRWTIDPGNDLFLVVTHSTGEEATGGGKGKDDSEFRTRMTEVTTKLQWTFRF